MAFGERFELVVAFAETFEDDVISALGEQHVPLLLVVQLPQHDAHPLACRIKLEHVEQFVSVDLIRKRRLHRQDLPLAAQKHEPDVCSRLDKRSLVGALCLVLDLVRLRVDRREHGVAQRERQPEAVQVPRERIRVHVRVRIHPDCIRDVLRERLVVEPGQHAVREPDADGIEWIRHTQHLWRVPARPVDVGGARAGGRS